ncbi:hypothetical protein OF83DRAFT_16289 [Amylostereum chailletii]|nr:hypothetical protein OF83DRAFT_16289 [Amylostereum chailletii]
MYVNRLYAYLIVVTAGSPLSVLGISALSSSSTRSCFSSCQNRPQFPAARSVIDLARSGACLGAQVKLNIHCSMVAGAVRSPYPMDFSATVLQAERVRRLLSRTPTIKQRLRVDDDVRIPNTTRPKPRHPSAPAGPTVPDQVLCMLTRYSPGVESITDASFRRPRRPVRICSHAS